MNFTFANILVITALIIFMLGVASWQRRKSPGAIELATILTGIGIWSFMYGLRWTTDQISNIYFWLNMSFFGIVMAPPAMLVFSIRFTHPTREITIRQLAPLAIVPVITLIFIWTDPLHGFFYGGHRSAISVYYGGFWLWFNLIYSFILMIFGVVLLFTYSHQAPKITRNQALIIMIGYLIPIVTCLIDIIKTSFDHAVDLTPFSFMASALIVMYGFFYHHLLDIAPVAYSKLIETSPDGIVVVDDTLRIVDMNPVAREILAPYSGEIGQTVKSVFSNWPGILASMKFDQESIAMIQMEGDLQRNYQVTITPFENSRGKSEGCFLVFHDITFFKQTENALSNSENKIRSLFQAITDIVLVLDRDGRYLEVAPTNPGILPSNPAQLIGKTIKDVFPLSDVNVITSAIHDALDFDKLVQLDYPLVVNGNQYWFSGNISPLTEDSAIWVARDITERKNMERILDENRTRLELAQKIAQVGSWEYNLQTGDFWASDEYFKIMGIDPKMSINSLEKLGINISTSKSKDWAQSIRAWIEYLSTTDNTMEFLREGETEPRTLHIVASLLNNSEGKPYKSSGVVQDITVQKRVERALEKRMLALTRPMDNPGSIEIEDLFNLDDLQKLQDDFANATGVASLITKPDGMPITKPSNFCRLCAKIIRSSEVGARECEVNDAEVSLSVSNHSTIIQCKSIGLMHAGAPIRVGGKLIATWLIGQVRTEDFSQNLLDGYIEHLNLDREEVMRAFDEIPVMTNEQFGIISQSLQTFSSQLSNAVFQNIQQARFITERKKAEEALQSSENKLRSLFKAMTDVIIIYDSKGNYREIPQTGSKQYFRPPTELLNKSIIDVLPEEISSLFLNTIHQTLETKELTRVDYSLNIDGIEYWFSANVSPFTTDSVIWVARDITDRKLAEETLQYQNMHDSLTGLYNRQYYEAEIERLQRSRLFPISILVMDVDGLKWVNDHMGHVAGDELLKRVAGILKSAFRPEDMVARMGGDEFVVVLPETGESAVRQVVDRLEKIVLKHNEIYPPDQSLGLSIGSATGGQSVLLTEVFKLADQAMYLKKKAKKELSAHAKTNF
jgi:diguanylate cyclase (GGDEF)-like protein/PAS domain S-box-containing protein